jgi:hypothetical protein
MEKKFVAENIEEAWVSSDSGADLYSDMAIHNNQSNSPDIDIDSMVPPPTMKLDPESFESFVDQLIQVIPEDPMIAFALFKKTLNNHPYLTRKTIGFRGQNLYEPIINKFVEALNNIR